MSRCAIKGCRRSGNINFQTTRFGDFREVDLCWSHGSALSRGEIFKNMLDQTLPKKKKKVLKKMKVASVNSPKVINNKDTLTLSNYKEVTGQRFRKTKDQVARGISREEAFLELMESI
jgi:hypothetical protein